jgi:hypothetical protein
MTQSSNKFGKDIKELGLLNGEITSGLNPDNIGLSQHAVRNCCLPLPI